jgi:hypothetical protein
MITTHTRFTVSSHAFLSSVALAVLTLMTSRCCDETTDRGPTGRSDSGEEDGGFEFRMSPLGLDVLRVGFAVVGLSVSDCC